MADVCMYVVFLVHTLAVQNNHELVYARSFRGHSYLCVTQ